MHQWITGFRRWIDGTLFGKDATVHFNVFETKCTNSKPPMVRRLDVLLFSVTPLRGVAFNNTGFLSARATSMRRVWVWIGDRSADEVQARPGFIVHQEKQRPC